MKLNLRNQEPNIEYIFNEKKMYLIWFGSCSTTGWVVHGTEKVFTILYFTLGVPRPA